MTTTNIRSELQSISKFLAHQWFLDQCSDVYKDYYLWCRKARDNEAIAHPIISEDKPNQDYWLVCQITRDRSEKQAYSLINESLQKQPILGN